jgi:uncharacterized protein
VIQEVKILLTIGTPAHVHFFRNIVNELKKRGHEILIAAPEDDPILDLLENNSLEFKSIGKRHNSSKIAIMLTQIESEFKLLRLAMDFKPDCLVAFTGIAASHVGKLIRKPSIIVTDTESAKFTSLISYPFASVILTQDCFNLDLGKKQVRFAGYKELAYLAPSYFSPDPSIYDELKISNNEKYVILRFNAFDAVHDVGRRGFSTTDQTKLVEELKKYARVFISSEGRLSKELESYLLPIAYNRIHHALYYAQLLICDTGTMATEAAVLGTPAVVCGNFTDKLGNFIELEQKYDLIYSFQESGQAIQKALELIKQPDLKEQWAVKRQKMLAEKVDVTDYVVSFIDNYVRNLKVSKGKST